MRQLELFSFSEEPQPVVVSAPDKETPSVSGGENIVFSDEKITVRIKPKQPPVPTTITTTETAEAVVAEAATAGVLPGPIFSKRKKVAVVSQKRGRKSFKEIEAEADLVEVPSDEILFEKQYYSISTVAGWFNVNNSLLRYWENEFDALRPRKNKKGDRLFRPEDVKTLQTIYYLLRQQKFTIEGAKEYLKVHKQGLDVQVELTQSLNKFRDFLLELKAHL